MDYENPLSRLDKLCYGLIMIVKALLEIQLLVEILVDGAVLHYKGVDAVHESYPQRSNM